MQSLFNLITQIQSRIIEYPLGLDGDEAPNVIRRMLDGTINKPFKQKHTEYVYMHRLESNGSVYYLKRSSYETPRKVLRHLLRGRRAYSICGWCYLYIKALQQAEIPVMKPVAWAEERWFGVWPRRGMLLLNAVAGEELVNIIKDPIPSPKRLSSLRALGVYVGLLHAKGFYISIRVHDFICMPKDGGIELVMIDVDPKGKLPESEAFSISKHVQALVYFIFLYLRVGHRIRPAEAQHFILSYARGLVLGGQRWEKGTLKTVRELVDKELLKPHDQVLFPDKPYSLAEAFSRSSFFD